MTQEQAREIIDREERESYSRPFGIIWVRPTPLWFWGV